MRGIGDAQAAALVRAELERLQAGVVAGRQLRALDRAARRELRLAKQTLEPLLRELGYFYHGQKVRQRRRPD